LLTGISPEAQAGAASSRPPNIIFILADDLGYGDLGCYGQKRIKTPRIDRMADEGMLFTQAYAGSTVCAPSRCVLMTGLHTGHCRVRGNGGAFPLSQALRPEDVTVARLLKNAGYATALTGKWGLGNVGVQEVGLPTRQGFDFMFGYLNQGHAHNYYPSHLYRNEERVKLRNIVPNETARGAGVATERLDYSHDLIADEALRFVRDHASDPFFLYLALTIPHANNEAGKRGMEVPDLGEYAHLNWPEPQKGHAAMITRMDRDVGRLLDLLSELGMDDQTLVVFTSDNGPHREGGNDPGFNNSSGPLRGIKRDLYEGGIRVPFIARWPGVVTAGSRNDHPVWFADFLPTAAELAGVEAPTELDGVSLRSTLKNPGHAPERSAPFYWEFFERGFKQALRDGEWKLLKLDGGRTTELYNLSSDPGEQQNVAAEHPNILNRLESALVRARVDSSDWPVKRSAGR
jgi:arylsulfatase A-like enzyme